MPSVRTAVWSCTRPGRVTPENWTHGSAEARMSWFNQGYETGDINQCNTFGVERVS